MKNWAIVALAAFLPRRPAPGLLGDDVEVDRRRPRTLVEDFIRDARPYESALPAGVEPASEVLQHFPETSFEQCPQMEAFTEKIRAASTSPEMLAHLDKTEPGRNPDKYKVPEKVADYYGRKWRGLESDALWAARELREKGVFALREVVPRDEVAALRRKAEDSWCAVASRVERSRRWRRPMISARRWRRRCTRATCRTASSGKLQDGASSRTRASAATRSSSRPST